jgi:5-methylcytosine-specific restriction endonuclease McrA
MTEYKACSRCKQILPYEAFNKKSSTPTGRASACANCTNERKRNPSPEQRERKNYLKRQWAKDNPEKIKQINKNSYKRSPEQFINNSARRYAKIKNVDRRTITNKELKHLHRQPCIYCGSTYLIEIDHIIPIARGGRHSIGNLAPACRACNRNKTDYLVMEWRIKRNPPAKRLRTLD